MGDHFQWYPFAAIVYALLLGAVAPTARRRLRAAVILISLFTVGLLLCALMLSQGLTDNAIAYRWIHFAAQLAFVVAIINLAGVTIFSLGLNALHIHPAPILRDVVLGLAYVIAFILLLSRHGVNLSGIIATSAVVTAVVGFSLQDTLGNVMGGMALQMERSIGVGDWIRIGDLEGLVREIRWRHTSIETRDWDTVVIPNSNLMKSQVTVLGRRENKPRYHRMWVYFHVDFHHSPADVIETVQSALRADPIPNIASDPPPECILKEFVAGDGEYAVRYWLTDFSKTDPTSSEIRSRIFVALRRSQIQLSIPTQSLHLTMESQARARRKQELELQRRTVALGKVAFLATLTDQERSDLAAQLSVCPFRHGEVITRQGNEAHYLYTLTQGTAEVRVAGANGESRTLATLKAGDVFGEMALLTGERRTASVVATTDTICYRLDKDSFAEILYRRPEIAEAISQILARRKLELDVLNKDLNTEALQEKVNHAQNDLLDKIRSFFMLR